MERVGEGEGGGGMGMLGLWGRCGACGNYMVGVMTIIFCFKLMDDLG